MTPRRVAFLVLNFNSAEDTLACLEALRAVAVEESRTWVIDNASTDDSAARLRAAVAGDREVFLESPRNRGYAGGNNLGLREAVAWGADYLVVLNPDCHPAPDFLSPLLSALDARSRAGIACPLVLEAESGCVQALGGRHSTWTGFSKLRFKGLPEAALHQEAPTVVDWPHGACMVLRRALLEEVGLLHEAYFLYCEDVEFGLRARRAGWEILAVPGSRVLHAHAHKKRSTKPLVAYCLSRNFVWVQRTYGRWYQAPVFWSVSLGVRLPLYLGQALLWGGAEVVRATAKGFWHGVFSDGFREPPPRIERRTSGVSAEGAH